MNEINSELVEYITSKYRDKEIPWDKETSRELSRHCIDGNV